MLIIHSVDIGLENNVSSHIARIVFNSVPLSCYFTQTVPTFHRVMQLQMNKHTFHQVMQFKKYIILTDIQEDEKLGLEKSKLMIISCQL